MDRNLPKSCNKPSVSKHLISGTCYSNRKLTLQPPLNKNIPQLIALEEAPSKMQRTQKTNRVKDKPQSKGRRDKGYNLKALVHSGTASPPRQLVLGKVATA